MPDNRPIGVFDSGLGGLTVLRAIHALLPEESTIYLGDTARVPYGNKSPETVRRYAKNGAQALFEVAPVKMLMVACNTVSAIATGELAQLFDVPVISVITPGADFVAQDERIKSVAVLGTRATIESEAYGKELRRAGFRGQIFEQPCPLFVPLVEEGMVRGAISEAVVAHYLSVLPNHIDAMILGCTHYPLMMPTLQKLCPPNMIFVDSGQCAATTVKAELIKRDGLACGANPVHRYLVTESPNRFETLFAQFLGYSLSKNHAEHIDIKNFNLPVPTL